jgi:hypothetical protein
VIRRARRPSRACPGWPAVTKTGEISNVTNGENCSATHKRTGDGSIIEFRSVVDAVNCAIEVQRAMSALPTAGTATSEVAGEALPKAKGGELGLPGKPGLDPLDGAHANPMRGRKLHDSCLGCSRPGSRLPFPHRLATVPTSCPALWRRGPTRKQGCRAEDKFTFHVPPLY